MCISCGERTVSIKSKGWCKPCYQRARRGAKVVNGTVGRIHESSSGVCKSCGMEAPRKMAKGWCPTCYQRAYQGAPVHGDVVGYKEQRPLTYMSIHKALGRKLGSAKNYFCTFCDEPIPARDWALFIKAEALTGYLPNGAPALISADMNSYVPLCRSHHVRLDRKGFIPEELPYDAAQPLGLL